MTRARPILLSCCLVLLLTACGGDDGGQGQTGSTRCTVGEKKACACTDGGTGFKTCKDDERWGSCSCSGGPVDDVEGGDDAAGDDAAGDDAVGPGDNGTCVRDCNGKQCGPDSCGGVCGTCPDGLICGPTYQCQDGPCVPQCAGRDCGPDGCTGSCGTCPEGSTCNAAMGQCEEDCVPDCSDLACGSDGCGGSCGSCPAGSQCQAGTCESTCQPSCAGKVCGDNGCGGSCGSCASGKTCQSGQCVSTTQIDCLQLYTECWPECADGDQVCAEACYDKLSPVGKSETDAFVGCLQSNGCYDAADFNQCMVQSCFGEYVGCFHGDKGCPQVTSCIDGCGTSDTTCWADCMAEGTADVQLGLYGAADQCLTEACCPTDQALCNEPTGQSCIQAALDPGGSCAWPTISCP